MAFGRTLTKLELTNCTNFQSGTALHIRKFCTSLVSLVLDIDSAAANSNAGLSEALDVNDAERNIYTLEHQVQDLQSRLNTLQVRNFPSIVNLEFVARLSNTPVIRLCIQPDYNA